MNLYIIIFLISCCEALAQSLLHYSNSTQNILFFIIAVLFYILASFFIYKAYDYKGVGMVNAIWSGMSIILMVSIGVFIFNETIEDYEWLGIILIIIGILITNKKNIVHYFYEAKK